jgi:hypothetical protein
MTRAEPILNLNRRLLSRQAALAIVVCVGVGASLSNGQTLLTHDASGYLRTVGLASNAPASILAHPRSAVAPTGVDIVFSVSARGSLPLTYHWQLNSNNIPGANTDTLFLTSLASNDFGAYRVIVSNAFGSVTSSNALLQIDSDRDGIADSWETNYFTSITNRSGAEDYDQDGASDLEEFLEGTHPRFSAVVNPRLTIISDNGEVLVTPNLPLFTNGQTVTLTGIPNPGLQFLSYLANAPSYSVFAMRTNPAQVRLTSALTVRAIFGLPIPLSLDVTNGGRIDQAGWFGQTNITHDGVDAMQSARILGLPEAWLELTNVVLASEGTITFWWKVDGTPGDELRFYRNNTVRTGAIGTNTDWQLRTYYLPAGTNIVRWVYDKNQNEVSEYNGLFYAPLDAAWVDQVTYAVWPNPSLDADADGMPDIWEFRYFDGTGAAPNADYDRDGISNLDEYLDGTNPDNNSSYLPRLTVLTSGGTVVRNPNLPKYTLGQTVQLQAVPDPENYFVIWSGAVSGTNSTNSVLMNNNKTVIAVFGLPLPVALETPALTWTRGGAIGFFGQTNFSHDGVDSAQAGPVGFHQDSWMETTVTGPGTLTFWWKALSLTNFSFARFFIDGVEQPEKISGATDWRIESYAVASGAHTLRWAYSNNTATASLTNGAWIDQVAFTNGSVLPTIYQQPADAIVLQGGDTNFSVTAAGTPPFHYRWFRNGVPLGNPLTNATLQLDNISLAQAGTYSVQVSNVAGTVMSSSAMLTVLPVPPANDNFFNRAPLVTGTAVLGYTHGATEEFGETNHAGAFGYNSIWWSWTAPSNGNYQVFAIGTNIYSPLVAAVYRGNSVSALTEMASRVGTMQNTNGVNLSRVTLPFTAVGGTQYALVLDHGGVDAFVTLVIGPAIVPRLGNASFSFGGPFRFSFVATVGANYLIEASSDLEVWSAIAFGTVPANGIVQFAETAQGTPALRFYRVYLLP